MERRICLIYSQKYIDSLIKFHVILLQFTIFILTYHLLRQNTCNKFIICKAVSMKRLWNWHRICIAVHRRTLTGSAAPTVLFQSVQGVLFPGVKRPWHEPLLLSRAGFKIFFFAVALRPNAGHGLLILEVSRSYTTTHHSRWDSSGRVISSSQRPLPDNTQQSQQTNIHTPGGIRTHDLSTRAAADLRLRPRGHWDRQGLRISDVIPTCTSMAWPLVN